jgi:RNA polymerase sigma-70 factor (ECF subfamily)
MGERARAAASPEDVVQDTLLKAYERMTRLEWRGEEAFYRWLGSIAEHLIRDEARGAARLHLGLEGDPPDRASSANRPLEREERLRRLEKAVAHLSPEHREAIVLTRIHGMRIAEAAGRMGRSPNAVRKLLGRALKDLRRRYGETSGSLRLPDGQLEIGGADDER